MGSSDLEFRAVLGAAIDLCMHVEFLHSEIDVGVQDNTLLHVKLGGRGKPNQPPY